MLSLVVLFAILLVGLTLISTRAWADFKVPESNPGLLSLWTDSYPLHYSDMAPGDEAFVRLNVELDDIDRGDLSLEVRKDGDLATLAGGLVIDVARCAVPWTNVPTGLTQSASPDCTNGEDFLLAADPSDDYALDSPTWDLGEIEKDSTIYMLVTLALPDSTPAFRVEGLSADFGFGLFADGEDAALPITPTRLAFTGVDILSLVLVGVGALGVGVVFSVSRRRPAVPR